MADADVQVVEREDVYEADDNQPSLVASFLSLFSSRAASTSLVAYRIYFCDYSLKYTLVPLL